MSEAKERFNMFIENENTDAETIISQAVIYISELEQQNKELIEFIKNIEDTNLDDTTRTA